LQMLTVSMLCTRHNCFEIFLHLWIITFFFCLLLCTI
jgi:hypothetical protein